MASKALMALMALEKGVGVVEAKSREECCQGLANQASAPAMHVTRARSKGDWLTEH
jgi:hypothetical protein